MRWLPHFGGSMAAMGGGIAPPTNTVAPVISGNTQVGQTLTTTDGTWTGSPTFTYQWKRGGANITGETATTYVLAVADAGQAITCDVTGTNGGGNATAGSNTLTIDVYVVLTAHVEDPADATTYSGGVWNGVAIGTAAANRKIVIGASARNSATTPQFSSGSVGGAALTEQVSMDSDAPSPGRNRTSISICDLTTGTTANISITWSAASARCGAGVWAVYGAASSTASDTDVSRADPSAVTLTVPAKGVAIGCGMNVGSPSAGTWTGLTEDFDAVIETTVQHSGASLNSSAGGDIAMQVDWAAGFATGHAAFAAWG